MEKEELYDLIEETIFEILVFLFTTAILTTILLFAVIFNSSILLSLWVIAIGLYEAWWVWLHTQPE